MHCLDNNSVTLWRLVNSRGLLLPQLMLAATSPQIKAGRSMALITDFFSMPDSLLGRSYFQVLYGYGSVVYVYRVSRKFVSLDTRGLVTGKHTSSDDPGDTSHFQALSTALSGTVGTGNIGGVAFAIFLGGPAA